MHAYTKESQEGELCIQKKHRHYPIGNIGFVLQQEKQSYVPTGDMEIVYQLQYLGVLTPFQRPSLKDNPIENLSLSFCVCICACLHVSVCVCLLVCVYVPSSPYS